MSDYADIASMSWENIPEPKVLPVGSYLLRGRNASYQPSKEEGKSPTFMFVYSVKEPMDDVDAEALSGLGEDYDLASNQIFFRIYVETAADFAKVRRHLALHGVEAKGDIKETLKKFKGTEVVAYLNQKQFTDRQGETRTDNNAETFAAVK